MRLLPRSMVGQMMLVLGASFALLLAVLTAVELSDLGGVTASARSEQTVARLRQLSRVLPHVEPGRLAGYLAAASRCHEGYAVSPDPWPGARETSDTHAIASDLAHRLGLPPDRVRAGRATLSAGMFGYGKCAPGQIDFPVEGVVISLRTPDAWVHAEVHPHEWHVRQTLLAWLQRLALVFVVVGVVAIAFMHRLARPLRRLTRAAQRFGNGLAVDPIEESGPQDVRRTIAAFNTMQRLVAEEVERRARTLAALSHDLRTPLTALRVKAELVEDETVRDGLVTSIRRMEAMSASAIEFLRADSSAEPRRTVDITALVESECVDFEDVRAPVVFAPSPTLVCVCQPEGLARAVRNLIDNAVKHGGGAEVSLDRAGEFVEIRVLDRGPGIPADQVARVVAPFVRLSAAGHEGKGGGFGLGLSVVKAVAEAHGGFLHLSPGSPSGLVATLAIPCAGGPASA